MMSTRCSTSPILNRSVKLLSCIELFRNFFFPILFIFRTFSERLFEFDFLRKDPVTTVEYALVNFAQIVQNKPLLTPQYLKHWAIILKLVHRRLNKSILLNILRLYYESGIAMIDPIIFNDPRILANYDKSHIAIYEADEIQFHRKPRWLDSITVL